MLDGALGPPSLQPRPSLRGPGVSPQLRLVIGSVAPRDEAQAEIEIICVFIALASGLQYNRFMRRPLEIHFSWFCASRYLKARVFIGGHSHTRHPLSWLHGWRVRTHV